MQHACDLAHRAPVACHHHDRGSLFRGELFVVFSPWPYLTGWVLRLIIDSTIPEAVGDAGLLVDEISADAFAACIRSLEGISPREAITQRGF